MNDNLARLFTSINFETEMLEIHDWDEQECNKSLARLSEYFKSVTLKDPELVKADLGFIFPEKISKVIINYMDIVFLDILTKKGDIGEA